MQTVEEIIPKLKELIIKQLNLEGVTLETFDSDMPLFGEGLGLDSIDAIELSVLLDRNFGIKLADPKEGRKVFQSVRTMAEYVQEHAKK